MRLLVHSGGDVVVVVVVESMRHLLNCWLLLVVVRAAALIGMMGLGSVARQVGAGEIHRQRRGASLLHADEKDGGQRGKGDARRIHGGEGGDLSNAVTRRGPWPREVRRGPLYLAIFRTRSGGFRAILLGSESSVAQALKMGKIDTMGKKKEFVSCNFRGLSGSHDAALSVQSNPELRTLRRPQEGEIRRP